MNKLRRLRDFSNYFYAHPYIRRWVGVIRYQVLSKIRGLRTHSSDWARHNTISHNLVAFEHISVDFAMRRMEMLLHAVAAIESVNANSRILVLGPRTESDILILKGMGYRNITGLDLISYSPYIQLGDMHAMPFTDGAFDVIVCGWTLSYSATPQLAVDEMLRVVDDGGLLAFGIEHVSKQYADRVAELKRDDRYVRREDDRERSNTVDDLLTLLGAHVLHVFFRHDAPLRDLSARELYDRTGLGSSQVMLVVAVQK